MADKNEEQFLGDLLDSLMSSNSDGESIEEPEKEEFDMFEQAVAKTAEDETEEEESVFQLTADDILALDDDLSMNSSMSDDELRSLQEMDAEYDGQLDGSPAEITDDLLAEIDGLILDDTSFNDMNFDGGEALEEFVSEEGASEEELAQLEDKSKSKADNKEKQSFIKNIMNKLFGKKKKAIPEKVEDMEDIKSNNNVDLINAVYSNVDSLDNVKVDESGEAVELEEKPKKEKKKKEPKPKKEKKKKEPKPKKEKKPKEPPKPSELVKVTPFTFIKIIVFTVIVVCAVIFGASALNYISSINSAKSYYDKGKYELAYDKVAGLEIKEEDLDFYNRLRTIMCVYMDYCSYNSYLVAGMPVEAIDSLFTALEHYDEYYEVAEEYEILDEYNAVKKLVVITLEDWGVSEEAARTYMQIENEEQYKEILENIGGQIQ